MSRRGDALPPTLAPRGLSREEAAAYLGIGTTLFDRLVADGRMPRPKKIEGRLVWDRRRIDLAFDDLPDNSPKADPWRNVSV